MICKVALTEDEIRQAISDYIAERTGIRLEPSDIGIQVKSKQNYRAEWEAAAIRCEFEAAKTQ